MNRTEYQRKINLLDNGFTQPLRWRTKPWVEINDDIRWIYNAKH